jgi:hypothetical protein
VSPEKIIDERDEIAVENRWGLRYVSHIRVVRLSCPAGCHLPTEPL